MVDETHQVVKITVENVTPENVQLMVRIRGENCWHFIECILEVNHEFIFSDGVLAEEESPISHSQVLSYDKIPRSIDEIFINNDL